MTMKMVSRARIVSAAVLALVVLAGVALRTAPAQAIPVSFYDVSIFVSVSPGPNLPPRVTFGLHPGFTVIPPASGNATAIANVPGQVFANATGRGTYVESSATAIGFVSFFNQQLSNVQFPLLVTPHWNISLGAGRAELAGGIVRSRFLLDDVELAQTSDSAVALEVTFGRPFPHSSETFPNHLTTPLLLDLEPGSHSLRFTAEASGLTTPEPGTLLLFGSSLTGIGLAAWRRRRRRHQT